MRKFKFIILVVMILSFFSCDNIYYGKKEPESDINGKKENTGKDTIQINEIQEKFKKLIQDMGLRTCRNASTIRISRNRCSNSSNCKIRKSVMYVVWK